MMAAHFASTSLGKGQLFNPIEAAAPDSDSSQGRSLTALRTNGSEGSDLPTAYISATGDANAGISVTASVSTAFWQEKSRIKYNTINSSQFSYHTSRKAAESKGEQFVGSGKISLFIYKTSHFKWVMQKKTFNYSALIQ